jgi:hypothetical protein
LARIASHTSRRGEMGGAVGLAGVGSTASLMQGSLSASCGCVGSTRHRAGRRAG